MNEIVDNGDGTYSMRIEVDGVEQLRECEVELPGRYLDGRPHYGPTVIRPVVLDDERLVEVVGGELRIIRVKE